jgi:hypothetical protein
MEGVSQRLDYSLEVFHVRWQRLPTAGRLVYPYSDPTKGIMPGIMRRFENSKSLYAIQNVER